MHDFKKWLSVFHIIKALTYKFTCAEIFSCRIFSIVDLDCTSRLPVGVDFMITVISLECFMTVFVIFYGDLSRDDWIFALYCRCIVTLCHILLLVMFTLAYVYYFILWALMDDWPHLISVWHYFDELSQILALSHRLHPCGVLGTPKFPFYVL